MSKGHRHTRNVGQPRKGNWSKAARTEGGSTRRAAPAPTEAQWRAINKLCKRKGLKGRERTELKARLVTRRDATAAITRLEKLRDRVGSAELQTKPPWLRKIINERRRQAVRSLS